MTAGSESLFDDRCEWVRKASPEEVAAKLGQLEDALGDAIDKWEASERQREVWKRAAHLAANEVARLRGRASTDAEVWELPDESAEEHLARAVELDGNDSFPHAMTDAIERYLLEWKVNSA